MHRKSAVMLRYQNVISANKWNNKKDNGSPCYACGFVSEGKSWEAQGPEREQKQGLYLYMIRIYPYMIRMINISANITKRM